MTSLEIYVLPGSGDGFYKLALSSGFTFEMFMAVMHALAVVKPSFIETIWLFDHIPWAGFDVTDPPFIFEMATTTWELPYMSNTSKALPSCFEPIATIDPDELIVTLWNICNQDTGEGPLLALLGDDPAKAGPPPMTFAELTPYFLELGVAFPSEYYITWLHPPKEQRWAIATIQRWSDGKEVDFQVDFDSSDPIGDVIREAEKHFPEKERGAPRPPGGITLKND